MPYTNTLRYTSAYDPQGDTVAVVFNEGEAPQTFLETKYRLRWFHDYLKDHNSSGYVDDSELVYMPEAKLILAKASVFINGDLVGRSCAGSYYTPDLGLSDPTLGQTVATAAKGRALSNAGFGTADCAPDKKNPPARSELPAAQGTIRACSYNPASDIIELTVSDSSKKPDLYLEVKNRLRWFHQYLRDRNTTGYVDDSEVRYDPAAKMLFATARVFIEGVLAGVSSASRPYDPDEPALYTQQPIARVCTAAKGRALANAGFGITASALEDGKNTPCDAGIQVVHENGEDQVVPLYQKTGPAGMESRLPVMPPEETPEPTQTEELTAPAAPAKEAPESIGPDVPGRMGYQAAKALVLPFGSLKGKTMAEAMNLDPSLVEFYASERFKGKDKYPQINEAALVMVTAAKRSSKAAASALSKPASASAETSVQKPKKTDDAGQAMTYEEAAAYVMPFGTQKGKTLKEIAETNADMLRFYASDKFTNQKFSALKRAAAAVLARG